MNTDIIQGKFHEMEGAITKKWGKITGDDLTKTKGSTEELLGLLQKHYGYEKDMAKKEVDQFIKDYDEDGHDVE